jgi:hypothetical protein
MRRIATIATAVAVTACVVVIGATRDEQAAQKTPQHSAAAKKITFPPIPAPGFAPGRPVDQTRAVYQFAAEHPEVLKYVPCYCGCESSGHPHNESCFVKRRDAAGNVVEWDTHGYG